MNLQNLVGGFWRDIILALMAGFALAFPFGRWTMRRSMRLMNDDWIRLEADYLVGLEEGFKEVRQLEAE